MKNYLKLFGLIITISLMLTGCSNNDDDSNNSGTDFTFLYNKWWYDVADFTADVRFSLDGVYDQKIVILGTEVFGSGDWQWTNESTGTMQISNLTGQGQTVSEGIYKIRKISDSEIGIQVSLDGGETFINEVIYNDVD
ncbi:MAG: hypothetical protein HRT68_10935 [Flavobacteriaceae bacterium]|nr:hypothetical protein [Flavobacteriaceae bacterium]